MAAPKLVEIEFKLRKGYVGRFDFDTFMLQSGLNAMFDGDEKDNEKKRQIIQRLYNDLTTLWEQHGFIRFVGFKSIKGRRGRQFKIYEPTVNLTFKWQIEDIDDEKKPQ